MSIDADAIIRDYRTAYLKGNGRELDARIVYESGWFVFRTRLGFGGRQRAAQMRQMIDRLNARWPEHVSAPAREAAKGQKP